MDARDDTDDILGPKGPQLNSENPEERKEARALRIRKRQEAAKKSDYTEERALLASAALEDGQQAGPVEASVVSAAEELQQLLLDGHDHVTNIRATCDEREMYRRFTNMDSRQALLQKMEDEAKEAEAKYNEIVTQWQYMLSLNDPLELDREMKEQTERCNTLVRQKDALIDELKAEVRRFEEVFEKDLKLQSADIKELTVRIDTQIEVMKSAYEKQLNLIEEAIESERATMIEHNQKRWEALHKQRDRDESVYMEKKFEQIEEFDEAIDSIGWDYYEKFRAAKVALETEIQTLQKELQKLRATCLINSEKIDYNYQVLKKREEENVFVRSQQKRKLNKMQDLITALRRKIRQAELDGLAEEERAGKEIDKLKESMLDLEMKAEHFAVVSDNKYQQVWQMNVERCNTLVEQIMQADRLIHEQLLGEEWVKPTHTVMKMTDMASYKLAEGVVAEKYGLQTRKEQFGNGTQFESDDKRKLVGHILNLVADNSGFLIEDRLRILLQGYKRYPTNLCKLDNVFIALEIRNPEDIEKLCAYFAKYAFCPICNQAASLPPIYQQPKTLVESSEQSVECTSSEQNLLQEAGAILAQYSLPEQNGTTLPIVEKFSEQEVPEKLPGAVCKQYSCPEDDCSAPGQLRKQYSCPKGHCLEIEEIHALTALQEFVSGFVQENERQLAKLEKLALPKTFPTVSRYLKEDDVEEFWNRYYTILSPQTEKLWDGLIYGLGKYLPILKDRHQINIEVQKLRQQNTELKTLMKGKLLTALQ